MKLTGGLQRINAWLDRHIGKPMVGSLLLHTLFFIVLLIGWSRPEVRKVLAPTIEVTLVQLSQPVPIPQPQQQQTVNLGRSAAPDKAIALNKHPKKNKVQKQQEADTLNEYERRKARERIRAEQAQQLKMIEQTRLEQEKAAARREQQRQDALAAEVAQQQLESDMLEKAKYTALIRDRVSYQWNRPPSAVNGMVAEVLLKLSPTGEVIDVLLTKTSNNDAFDRSVMRATQQAGPFEDLKFLEKRLFDQSFRSITLQFRPEDLVR